jgi:tripartite-type tricarboxylate transporter receptor subunit TctC
MHWPNNKLDQLCWLIVVAGIAGLISLWVSREGEEAAASFPTRTLTIICPYAAGGGTDLFARGLARAAERELGRTITVNNVTGGAGAIGHAAGIVARPDGYTVTAVTFELVSLPLQGLAPFTHEDFDLLMRVNMDPGALAVQADFPADTLDEFIAWVRKRGRVQIANSGPGSSFHLASARMSEVLELPVSHIPFHGASPAITALVGGHVDAVVVGPGEMQVQVEAGNIKVLAVMSEERLDLFPDFPTFRELGHDVVMGTWRGLAVPKGTSPIIRERLTEAFLAAMNTDEFRTFARRGGLNLAFADGETFREAVRIQSEQIDTLMDRLDLK